MNRPLWTIITLAIIPTFAVAATLVASPSTEAIEDMLRLPGPKRAEALADQPDSVYKILLKISENHDEAMDIRWRALTGAAMVRRDKSADDMMKFTESNEWYIRNAALVSLAEFSPKQALVAAKALVHDPALVVRSAAVDVMDKYGADAERTILWSELAQPYNRRGKQSLWIRPQIVKALSKNPKAEEQKKFTALLADSDEGIRVAASAGLDQLSNAQRAPAASTTK